MRFFIVTIFVFIALSGKIAFALAFGETETKDFLNFGKWKITAENGDGKNWCRAIGQFDGGEVTILLGQLLPQYGGMLLSITTHQRTLPAQYKGSINLLIDNKTVATGTISDVGDWQGDKRIAFYARADFNKIEPIKEKLQQATKLTIVGDKAIFEPFELKNLDLNLVITKLQSCLRYPKLR